MADPALRRSYSDEIAPRTEAALRYLFHSVELPVPRRVLDLGAGTGAAGRAVMDRHPEALLTSVDYVPGPGILRADLSHPVRPQGVTGQYDWILAAHLLNELAKTCLPESLNRLVEFWCDEFLAPKGVFILIEPALRETSRGLLRVRDFILGRGLIVLAPCLCQDPCPALKRERDFCHDSAPAIVSKRSRVDFSYLVLCRQPPRVMDPTQHYRVVSDPMKDKGRLRLFVCGITGRHLVTRLDRDKSTDNQAFGQIERGELIQIKKGVTTGDGLRLLSDSLVCRCA